MVKNRSKVVTFLIVLFTILSCSFAPVKNTTAAEKLNRNQLMLLNLKSEPQSAGYYLVNSYHMSKIILQDSEKALNQIIAVDKAYAKYRRRPDDRFLQKACLKVTLVKQTAQDLQEQLQDAFAELKASVDDTIITDENFPVDRPSKSKRFR